MVGARRSPRIGRVRGGVSSPRRAAAVDIGSTSVHLLVGELSDGELEPIVDLSEILGLGAQVGAHGYLGPEAREELTRTLAEYVRESWRQGCLTIALVGTDPLRHAADAARACHEIELATGQPVHVIDQAEEGALTLLGVDPDRGNGELS